MSDKGILAEKTYLYKNAPNAPNGINTNNPDSMFEIDMMRGKRAKRVIDAGRTSQNYHKTSDIHRELFSHYEDVDWYERDSKYDFDAYVDKL